MHKQHIACSPINFPSVYKEHKHYLNSSQPNIFFTFFKSTINMTIVEMRVHMDCPGCEARIKKALSKLKGVDNIYIDMKMQKVTVMGWADQKKVLKTVRNTGRIAEIWPYPYNPEYHGYAHKYYFSNNIYDSPAPTKNFYSGQRGGGHQYFTEPKPSSVYNYHVHGYNGHEHGYYQQPLSSGLVDEGTRFMFSDENVHGCSIM